MYRYQNCKCLFILIVLSLFISSCSDSQTGSESAQKTKKTVSASVEKSSQQVQQTDSSPIPAEAIFRSISPKEAYTMLRERDDIIFLDVRTPQERAEGAIAGSNLVAFWDLVKGRVPLPHDKPILLVCAVGGRSFAAGQVLSRNGYREVYNLSGGLDNWFKAGFPISRSDEVTGSSHASN